MEFPDASTPLPNKRTEGDYPAFDWKPEREASPKETKDEGPSGEGAPATEDESKPADESVPSPEPEAKAAVKLESAPSHKDKVGGVDKELEVKPETPVVEGGDSRSEEGKSPPNVKASDDGVLSPEKIESEDERFEKSIDELNAEEALLKGQVVAFAEQWLRLGDRREAAASALAEFPSESNAVLASALEALDVEVLLEFGQGRLANQVVEGWRDLPERRERERALLERLSREQATPIPWVTARLGLKLARNLAIRQPAAAKAMVEKAREVVPTDQATDLSGIEERAKVGEVMEKLDSDDHEFWEACLAWEGEERFSWESPGARDRLSKLAGCLRGRSEPLPLLQSAVPGCWWDEVTRPVPPQVFQTSPWRFTAGLVAGLIVAPLAFVTVVETAPELNLWWQSRVVRLQGAGGEPQAAKTPTSASVGVAKIEEVLPEPAVVKMVSDAVEMSEVGVDGTDVPQMSPSETGVLTKTGKADGVKVAAKDHSSDQKPESKPKAISKLKVEADVVASSPQSDSKAKLESSKSGPPPHPNDLWREAELKRVFEEESVVERVHGMICRGTQRENLRLLLGGESVLPAGTPQYCLLMKALLLSPPPLNDVRQVSLRQAVRFLDVEDLIGLIEKLNYKGSPNQREILELADLTLALHGNNMPRGGVDRLWNAVRKKTPKT